jgi:uncharacterized protein YjbI with pentapeptide repeats
MSSTKVIRNSSNRGPGAEESGIDRAIRGTLRVATSWFVKLSAYVAAVLAAVIGIKTLPAKIGLSPGLCAVILTAPIALAAIFHTVPAFLEKRRRNRLKLIRGSGKAGYFQLAPRQDEESFQRADAKHLEVLDWLGEPPRRLLYLTGASGAGKSSLLSAWVIPHLERDGTTVIRLRGYQDPAGALEAKLIQFAGEGNTDASPSESLSTLFEAARRRIYPSRLLVVFDQFEEFLILAAGVERDKFVEFLRTEAAKQNDNASILLVFRVDYDQFVRELNLPNLIPGENLQKVPVFTEVAARDFLLRSGLKFDEQLQSSVLREAAETEGTRGLIRPVTVNLCGLVLSRFATGLPRQFRPGRMIRGFVRESIFQPDIADVTPLLLPKLISAHVTKVPRSVSDLAQDTPLTAGQVRGVMFRLGEPDRAIVRPLDSQHEAWEISHDYLVPIIDSMMAQWRSSLLKIARQWLPLAAVAILLMVVFAGPRLMPDPITDLSAKGWTIQPGWSPSRGGHAIVTYDLACPLCQAEDIEGSTWDLQRVPVSFDVTLTTLEAFDSRHFGEWAKLKNLRSLTLAGNAGLDDISAVSNLPRLTVLNLRGDTSLLEAELYHLPPSLNSLVLQNVHVSDALIGMLPRNLQTLDLSETGVTDASIRDLPPRLSILNLSYTAVTGVSFRDLPRSLVHLSLDDTPVTDDGLRMLPRSLQGLDLSKTRITDSGIAQLPPSLSSLDLSSTDITDKALEHLPRNLSGLDVGGTKVTKAGLTKLPSSVQLTSFSLRPTPPTGFRAFVIPSR